MKIGDEVYIHGYVDEIRYDDTKRVSTVIIRNDGGYFGTVPSEIDRKTEPTCSKMEQVDKDINVRSKDEPQNGYHIFNSTSVYVSRLEDEPQTDCPWK